MSGPVGFLPAGVNRAEIFFWVLGLLGRGGKSVIGLGREGLVILLFTFPPPFCLGRISLLTSLFSITTVVTISSLVLDSESLVLSSSLVALNSI